MRFVPLAVLMPTISVRIGMVIAEPPPRKRIDEPGRGADNDEDQTLEQRHGVRKSA